MCGTLSPGEMERSLPVPQQPCPTCGARLVVDGERHVCAACGRAFDLTVAETEVGASVYRSAPIVDLAPLRYPVPWSGVTVLRDADELDIRVSARGGRWTRWAWGGAALAAVTTGFVSAALHPSHTVGFLASVVLGIILLGQGGQPPNHHDALTIANRRFGPPLLEWTVRHKDEIVRRSAAELGRLTGAFDRGDHVRVEFDDGQSWNVGEGRKLSDAARRWLAWRLSKLSARLGG